MSMFRLWSSILTGNAIILLTTASLAADWPQWRGPNRDAYVADAAIRSTWPKALKEEWKVTVGVGHSSPIVANGKIYVFARQDEAEVLLCLDVVTGNETWRSSQPISYEMNPAAMGHGKGPKSTPAVSNGNVYTFGITGVLSCHDARTGKLKWRREFSKQYPNTSPLYGTAMSPVVDNGVLIAYKDTLIFSREGQGLAAIRLVKQDNEIVPQELWRNNDNQLSLNTPVLQGNLLLGFSVRQKGQFFAIDVDTGKTLWQSPGRMGENAAILNLGGKALLLLSNDANLIVLSVNAKEYAPVTQYTVADSQTWAHPVVIGNRILIKDETTLRSLKIQ